MGTVADQKQALAIDGGKPVRQQLLPYGRQSISDEDIDAVVDVLRSDWLTTGPKVGEFEAAFAEFTGARHAVAVSNGTAALHAAVAALSIGPGDEVIVSALTFAASANCIVYERGTPVFADVEPDTLLINPAEVSRLITERTKAIVAVDYAGQPCDYDALRSVASANKIALIDDASHALGAEYRGCRVGHLADLNTFSLHPVKTMTTGEGGVITTDDPKLAQRMRTFRNHGITSDHRQREAQGSWAYEMVSLGYNYRITDFQCALGISQLRRVPEWVSRRREIAATYDEALAGVAAVRPLARKVDIAHGFHLYVVRLNLDRLSVDRGEVFRALRAEGVGLNVHYLPVYLHPFYRDRFATKSGLCPVAEAAYDEILSLPIFPAMSNEDINDVIYGVRKVTGHYAG